MVQKVAVEQSGSIKDYDYGIGDLGLIFEILRNKLYTDPILAVVREYSTNAKDAHAEIGKSDVPIEISLPTKSDLYFKVKDFGPGISPERVANVFVNMAASTKRSDEEQVGYFGIGSKSAFAYSDVFNVISVTDGVSRTYTSFIDPSRKGKMTLLSESETDLPNGTTIVIPVRAADISSFEDRLKHITQYWSVKPIVKKNGLICQLDYPEETLLLEGSDWYFTKAGYYDAFPKAVMGGIGYKIDLSSHFINSKYYSLFNNSAFRIKFGNSDLSLSASRDSIHYDKRTIATIKQKMDAIGAEIEKIIEEQVSKEQDYKSALIKYNSIRDNLWSIKSSMASIKFDGKELFPDPKLSIFDTNVVSPRFSIYYKDSNDWKQKTITCRNYTEEKSILRWLSKDKCLIIFNDECKSVLKPYFSKILESNSNLEYVVFLTIDNDKTKSDVHSLNWFVQEICDDKISNINPDKVVKTYNRRKLSDDKNVFLYSIVNSLSVSDRKIKEVPLTEDFCYLILDLKNNNVLDNNMQNLQNASCVINDLAKLQIFLNKSIYGVSVAKLPSIIITHEHLSVAVEKKINETLQLLQLPDVDTYLSYADAVLKFEKYFDENLKVFEDCKNPLYLKVKSDFDKMKKVTDLVADKVAFSSAIHYSRNYRYDGLKSSSIRDFGKDLQSILDDYPLLKRFDYAESQSYNYSTCSYVKHDIAPIKQYIKFIDDMKGYI
jgi:hypothetical protein